MIYEITMESKFFEACKDGDLEEVKSYINNGGDVDVRDKDETHENQGPTPLHLATLHGYHPIVKYLLESGANYELAYNFVCIDGVEDGNFTALAVAIQRLEADIVKLLLSYGANPLREVGIERPVSTYDLVYDPIYEDAMCESDRQNNGEIIRLLEKAVKTPRKSRDELLFEESKRLRQERLKNKSFLSGFLNLFG